MKHLILFENFKINETTLVIGEAEAKGMKPEDFKKKLTYNGKYVFDDKYDDKEKEELLMDRIEEIIKERKMKKEEGEKFKKTFEDGIKKKGIKGFKTEIEKRYNANDGTIIGDKLAKAGAFAKREIMKGYKQPLMQIFDDMYDFLVKI